MFVDGCFWHGCPLHLRTGRKHRDWWEKKIAKNRERDSETDGLLCGCGWSVVRVWEHEDVGEAVDRIESALARCDLPA